MSGHQGNQSNASTGTYQYQWGDQVLEIPSNINYQLENIIAAGGGVQYILSDGSILVQKETKKDSNKNNFRRMIVLNQPSEIAQAASVTTTQTVPATQQRIITQQIPSNGNVETKNTIITNVTNAGTTTTSSTIQQNRSGAQVITPMGPLTLTPEEYNELMQRRMQKQAEADAQRRAQQEAQERAQQEAQQRAAQQEAQQRAQQEAQQRAQQLHHQQQLQDHQNIAVQVQKIVQSLEEEVEGKKEESEDIEMQLIVPKMEASDVHGTDGSEHSSIDQQHIQKQTKSENADGKGAGRPFACEQCGKKFLLKHHLTTHARVHTGERPHVCIHCGKDFAHKHCLNTHLLLHSTERPFQCTECKKCFTLKHHLLTHSRVHSRSRPFVCTECGKTFSLKRHLVTHMKFHAGERPYVCETCGESFAQEQHLVMHSRFHGSVDPFVCQDCGASFPRKFQLVNHGKLHGRVPHECTVCGQEFLQKRTLVAHMRQHTDAPHVCLECSEGFRTKSELTAHQRIVHNIQPPVRNKHGSNATSTATSQQQQSHEEDQIEQHQQEMEDDQHQYLKQEQQQYETVQIQDHHQNYQIMVPSGSNSSTIEHKTIRIQQQQNVQNQHICPQCGSCFSNREALHLHLRLHTGDKGLMTDLCALTAAIPGHIFQSGGNAYIEIDGGKYNITNGATIMANTGGSSPVPVQIITSANGQQVIEQVQSISPSLLQQQSHVTQQEVQISNQQGQIVYTTVPQDSPVTQTVLVQQHQNQQQVTQQPQQHLIVHNQPHHPKPKTHFCQHCNKGFANKHGLQLHNKRHPNGECTVRSHICTECNRAFFQKNHLLLHQRQHMEQHRGAGQVLVQTETHIEDAENVVENRTNGQDDQQPDEIDEAVENHQKLDDTQDESGIDALTAAAASDNHSNEMRTQNVIVTNNNNNNIESDEKVTKVVVQDGSLGSIQMTTTNEASVGSSMDQGE